MHSLVASSSDSELYAPGYGCYYCLCGSSRFYLAGSSMGTVQLMLFFFFYNFAIVLRSSIQAINMLNRVTKIEKLSILISSKHV